jgi:hypothetical protein
MNYDFVVSIDKLKIKLKEHPPTLTRYKENGNMFSVNEYEFHIFSDFIHSPKDEFIYKNILLKIDEKSQKYYRNDDYKNVYSIYIFNSHLGYISFNPYNHKIYKPHLICFDVENKQLYTSNFFEKLSYLLQHLNLEINNIEVLELSLDTNIDLISRFMFYYKKEDKYYFKSCGKVDKTILHLIQRVRNTITNEGILIKNRYEVLRIYDKTKEIETSDKRYILNYLKEHNIDIDIPVFRMEFSIKNESIYKMNKKTGTRFDIFDLKDTQKQVLLFRTYLDRFIDFRMKNNTPVSKMKKIKFLKFPSLCIHDTPKLLYITSLIN